MTDDFIKPVMPYYAIQKVVDGRIVPGLGTGSGEHAPPTSRPPWRRPDPICGLEANIGGPSSEGKNSRAPAPPPLNDARAHRPAPPDAPKLARSGPPRPATPPGSAPRPPPGRPRR